MSVKIKGDNDLINYIYELIKNTYRFDYFNPEIFDKYQTNIGEFVILLTQFESTITIEIMKRSKSETVKFDNSNFIQKALVSLNILKEEMFIKERKVDSIINVASFSHSDKFGYFNEETNMQIFCGIKKSVYYLDDLKEFIKEVEKEINFNNKQKTLEREKREKEFSKQIEQEAELNKNIYGEVK